MRRLVTIIINLLGSSVLLAADPCTAAVPPKLIEQLAAAFPKYRVPLVTDNLPEDVQFNKANGGNGCLGVATADFDGDGKQDLLLGLSAREGDGGLVVVALSRSAQWELHSLNEWTTRTRRDSLFVKVDKPGSYARTEALEGPLEPGERDPLKCKHSVAVFGTIESSAVAYCFKGGKWEYAWIAD